MKRLNIPLLAVLTIGSLVLVVGTHILHVYQVGRNADNLKERAKKAEANGDVDEQIRILRRYLRYRPDDVDELKVSRITVDEAPTYRRYRARAKGRGARIIKRNSHITVQVAVE